MNEANHKDVKLMLSSYDENSHLIKHFKIIDNVEIIDSIFLLEFIRKEFEIYIDNYIKPYKDKYVLCKSIFLRPDRYGKEYTLWTCTGYTPISQRYQSDLFYYSPQKGINQTQ